MKKLTLGAIAGTCAVAALVWSVPASASHVFERHNHNYGFADRHDHDDPPVTSVPEPGAMGLLALGLGGLALRRRSRKD